MLNFQSFTLFIIFLILAPIVSVISLLMFFVFEKRFNLIQKEKRNIDLNKELQTAKYLQLTEQINPHFLFNTLNAIMSLARLDRKKELIKSLEIFSLFLKFKYNTTDLLVPIKEELKYTEYYIEIQKLRFQDKLKTNILIEENLTHYLMPPFMLQTLVENSFKHALETSMFEAYLEVKLMEKNNYIILFVTDNGAPAIDNSDKQEQGHGLTNIHLRLSLSFPNDASIIMCPASTDIGTIVRVQWPKTKTVKI